jgi:hypothetical protein
MNHVPLSFNTQNNHPLIPREQNYVLSRKLLTVHSEDRDVNKWRNANFFEIVLPESIKNVQSMRLVQSSMPSHFYNISEQLQNNKMVVNGHNVIVPDGFYSPDNLANAITDAKVDMSYNSITQKFQFHDVSNVDFTKHCGYKETCAEQHPGVWTQYTKWGLGSYLGFEKKNYTFEISGGSLVAPHFPKLDGEQVIYMEVDKYNSYDELYPYSASTSSLYNNDYAARVNSAFAKIPLIKSPQPGCVPPESIYDSRNGNLQNVSYFDPPMERVQKLKFKFRYHNGMLVDFQDMPFNFTIEFNCLHNEIEKVLTVKIPGLYNL